MRRRTFAIESPRGAIRLAILTPAQRRNRPRKSEEPRLSAEALSALIAQERRRGQRLGPRSASGDDSA